MLPTYVTLAVDDVARATRFYRVFLGRNPTRLGDGHAFFDLDGPQLALFERGAMERASGLPVGQPGATALSWNVESEQAVGEVVGRAVEAGAVTGRPTYWTPWGAWAAWLTDPDGHIWEIVWTPRRPAEAPIGQSQPTVHRMGVAVEPSSASRSTDASVPSASVT